MKRNCWEHKKCGREPGGAKADELGVCPVTTATCLDEMHGGRMGGRTCWVVTGTLCGGKVQGSLAQKAKNCTACDFYKIVTDEEGMNIKSSNHLLATSKQCV